MMMIKKGGLPLFLLDPNAQNKICKTDHLPIVPYYPDDLNDLKIYSLIFGN